MPVNREPTPEASDSLSGTRWVRRHGKGDRGVPRLTVTGVSRSLVDDQNQPLLEIDCGHGVTGLRGRGYLRANYRQMSGGS